MATKENPVALNELDQARVRRVIARHLGFVSTTVLGWESVTASQRIMADLGGDSLDCVELVLEIESEFKVFLPDIPKGDDPTVQDYIDLLAQVRH